MTGSTLVPATREALGGLPAEVAPGLLGGVLETEVDRERVRLRITEVEAYHGRGTGEVPDPGSHARMGPTARNATMWGEPGRLYVYLSHGIHSCVNVVCGPEGVAGGILLRAGEIVSGTDAALARRLARRRRPVPPPAAVSPPVRLRQSAGMTGSAVQFGEDEPVIAARDLARGPGRLGDAVGLRHPVHDGIDAVTGAQQAGAVARLWLPAVPAADVAAGPRVGVAGVAGTDAYPWRFWLAGDPTVSPFRWGRGARP